jgi:hypothetical protein
MAYQKTNLSVLAYANGFTLWHYTTTEANTAIEAANYFNSAAPLVRPGDMVLSNTSTGTTPVGNVYLIASNNGSTVGLTKLV